MIGLHLVFEILPSARYNAPFFSTKNLDCKQPPSSKNYLHTKRKSISPHSRNGIPVFLK